MHGSSGHNQSGDLCISAIAVVAAVYVGNHITKKLRGYSATKNVHQSDRSTRKNIFVNGWKVQFYQHTVRQKDIIKNFCL